MVVILELSPAFDTVNHNILLNILQNHYEWLPIEQQIQFKILTITYKGKNNTAPKYIMDLIKISKSKRDNMWSNKAGIILNLPPVKYKTFVARSFSHAATKIWNELPKNIRESKTLDKFKQLLKTHLHKRAFNQ